MRELWPALHCGCPEILTEEKKVVYSCIGGRIGKVDVKGCGHKGEADITKGEGKFAWKVEFGARWQAFDIRFEAYGKDIMDSVRVNDWVADEILGYPHPLHVKYEMFLDKSGKKISKSCRQRADAPDVDALRHAGIYPASAIQADHGHAACRPGRRPVADGRVRSA